MKLNYLLTLCFPLMLTACGGADTLRSICKDQPQLCSDLNSDGWCRVERSDVIRDRYAVFVDDKDSNKYQLIKSLESYEQCITRAAAIEPLKGKERKTQRVDAMLAAENQLIELREQTKDSTSPEFMLYHWEHSQDYKAYHSFMALEGTADVDTILLQWGYARIYFERDPERSMLYLLHTLELYSVAQQLPNSQVIEGIITLKLRDKDFANAYIWSMVLEGVDETRKINQQTLALFQNFSKQQKAEFEQKAQRIIDAIQDNTFRRSLAS